MSDTLDQDFVKELMFDDSFTRSELYFKTLQLLRTFSESVSDSLASIDYLRHYFLPHMGKLGEDDWYGDSDDDEEEEERDEDAKATSHTGSKPGGGRSSNASVSQNSSEASERLTPEDKNAMAENWITASNFLKAAEARLQERISRKTEEVKSLRDGVSSSSLLMPRMCFRADRTNVYLPSFSTPRHSVKLPGDLP